MYSSYVFIFFHFLRPRNKINITAANRIRGKKDATGLLIADGAACAYAIEIIVNTPYFGEFVIYNMRACSDYFFDPSCLQCIVKLCLPIWFAVFRVNQLGSFSSDILSSQLS